MRKAFLLPFFALALLLLACNRTVVEEEIQELNPPIIGGERDEHGCLGPAGYSWCEPKQKCMRMWEEECYATTEEAIKYAFAEKYEKEASAVEVIISSETQDHARGMVTMLDEESPGNSGMFLATKINSVLWRLVFDGNGAFSCTELEQYEFPEEMKEGCY